MPVLFRLEYQMGYWILHNPHQFPPPLRPKTLDFHEWWSWTTFLTVGEPILLGSLVIAVPSAIVCYFVVHATTTHYRRKKTEKPQT
jgi:uncharacterized protein (DUF2062 family)